ncbi:patatin-like phospholipase family protein [Zhongshania aliphaticivorans]|uniref:patatin-like phospholipase family protein n=1 Tax=Zhongshania aliphaticivorans TaxID=1470434 RepID=UPI0012E58A3D|nr:patatin-like phospholipase family protein [Zhongshania aliphaticivorans]CAA0100486.1 putative NTE family protein [Zhongshania aliphaticivorans]
MEDATLGNKKIALALGSGSARGMAHIGVIQRLGELGIQPDIICGTSIGSVIAGCYLTGKLEHFTDWIQSLSTTQVLHYMSVSLTATGGVAHATRLIEFFINEYGNPNIEDLNMPFAAVATDLMRGREVWLQRGPLWDAVRASMGIPGILTPVAFGNSWLVDGGLVNPVPVSVCRALGADIIIGVDLNSDLVGRQKVLTDAKAPANEETIEEEESEDEELLPEEAEDDPFLGAAFSRFANSIKEATSNFRNNNAEKKPEPPSTMSVMMSAINIMQDRITRSRLAGEPADIMLWPRLGHIGLLEFSSAAEAIVEGRDAVDRMLPAIRHAFMSEGDDRILEPTTPQPPLNT